MNTNTASIPAKYFKAALLCAAKQDVRYYLNGIFLDFPAGYIVGTDGHRAFIGKLPDSNLPAVIVPRELVESMLKSLGARNIGTTDVIVTLAKLDSTKSVDSTYHLHNVTLGAGSNLFTADEIDGKFPEYARIVPKSVSNKPGHYNFQYLADAANALSWYFEGQKSRYGGCPMGQNDNGTAVLWQAGHEDAIVVVMPMRMADTDQMPDIFAKPAQEQIAA